MRRRLHARDRARARTVPGPIRGPICALVLACGIAACDAPPDVVLRNGDVAAGPEARATSCIPATDADATDAADAAAGAGGRRERGTWRVRRGDTLRGIARRVYGDERFADEVARANPGTVGRDGSVRAGSELVLPWDVR